jgi:hypothetical protein
MSYDQDAVIRDILVIIINNPYTLNLSNSWLDLITEPQEKLKPS